MQQCIKIITPQNQVGFIPGVQDSSILEKQLT